jgi:hypothetical protein
MKLQAVRQHRKPRRNSEFQVIYETECYCDLLFSWWFWIKVLKAAVKTKRLIHWSRRYGKWASQGTNAWILISKWNQVDLLAKLRKRVLLTRMGDVLVACYFHGLIALMVAYFQYLALWCSMLVFCAMLCPMRIRYFNFGGTKIGKSYQTFVPKSVERYKDLNSGR